MFKPIPGHETLTISLNGQMQYRDGTACALPIAEGKVELTLYGTTRRWDITWLGLVAHYEMFFPPGHEHRLFEVRFTPVNPKLRKLVCGQMPVIRKPIEVKPGFRLVLPYSHLAVSRNGRVLSWKSGEIHDKFSMAKKYLIFNTRSPDKSRNTIVGVHRLVALAWVPNKDWMETYIVNHRDGVRDHNVASNLEWVSFTGNSDHAIETGARPEAITCRVLDTVSDTEHSFASQRRAAEFMGLEPDALKAITRYLTPGKRIGGRYEFRTSGDDRPWFSRTHGDTPSGRYTIHLTYPDGRVENHPDVRTFIREFKVWNANSIEKIQARFRQLYPTVEFSYTDHYDAQPLQAYELATGKVLESDTIRGMTALTGEDFNTIRRGVKGLKARKDPKWLYRYHSTEPWQTEIAYDKSRPKRILATHNQTQEQRTYDSLRACSAAFGVDRDLIKLRLTTGRDHQGWVFTEIES